MSDVAKTGPGLHRIRGLAWHSGGEEEREEVLAAAAAATEGEVERLLLSSSKPTVNNAGNDHGRQKGREKEMWVWVAGVNITGKHEMLGYFNKEKKRQFRHSQGTGDAERREEVKRRGVEGEEEGGKEVAERQRQGRETESERGTSQQLTSCQPEIETDPLNHTVTPVASSTFFRFFLI